MEFFEQRYAEILTQWLRKQEEIPTTGIVNCDEITEITCCDECALDTVRVRYLHTQPDVTGPATYTFYGTLVDLVATLNRYAVHVRYKFPPAMRKDHG